MKKNIIVVATLVMVCFNSLRAQETAQVNSFVTTQFNKKFDGALNVRWEKHRNQVSMAKFRYNNENWLAFYGKEGELISSGREIAPTQLPVTVKASLSSSQKKLEHKYGAFVFGKIFEMVSNSATLYYIPLENEIMSIMVTVDSNGSSSVRRKEAKSGSTRELKPFIAKKD